MWERVSRESRTSLCYLLDDGYRIASVITWIHRFLTCERVSRESRTSLCYLLDDGYRIASVITWIHRFL